MYYIVLLVEDNSVLLQARCHCRCGVGVCGRMCSGQHAYIESTYSVWCCVYISYYTHSRAIPENIARVQGCIFTSPKDEPF